MGRLIFFFFQAEDGIRYLTVTGVQTCALPISDGQTPPDGEWEGGPPGASGGLVRPRAAGPRRGTAAHRDRAGRRHYLVRAPEGGAHRSQGRLLRSGRGLVARDPGRGPDPRRVRPGPADPDP